MRGCGRERVIRSLFSIPRLNGKAYISNLLVEVKRQEEEKAYKVYVAESLRLISENLAKQVGGRYMTAKFADIIDPKPKDDRTAQDIINDVIQRTGIEVRKN